MFAADFTSANGSNMATYTLGQAAKKVGLSKPTISKFVREGRISATRNDDGSFSIDGAELTRFAASYTKPSRGRKQEKKDVSENVTDLRILEVELRNAREKIADLERREEEARQQAAEALAKEREANTRYAAAIENRSKKPSVLERLFGLSSKNSPD